jgi:hypothetical protein
LKLGNTEKAATIRFAFARMAPHHRHRRGWDGCRAISARRTAEIMCCATCSFPIGNHWLEKLAFMIPPPAAPRSVLCERPTNGGRRSCRGDAAHADSHSLVRVPILRGWGRSASSRGYGPERERREAQSWAGPEGGPIALTYRLWGVLSRIRGSRRRCGRTTGTRLQWAVTGAQGRS